MREQGHDVRLIPAPFVKPFVKSNKNEFLDAEAIVEAVDRKNMRFVPIKTDDQLDPAGDPYYGVAGNLRALLRGSIVPWSITGAKC